MARYAATTLNSGQGQTPFVVPIPGFVAAYASAAAISVAMIASYTAAMLRSVSRGLTVLVLLAGLHAILFSLLRLEDYALPLGTALLVAVVAALMVGTRNLQQRGITPQASGTVSRT